MTDNDFHGQILPLVEVIKNTLNSEKKRGEILFDIVFFDRWESASLDYKETGFHLAMRGSRIKKPYTYSTSIKIAGKVNGTSEYSNLIKFVKTNTQIEENPVNLVNYFILRTIEKYFENEPAFESEITECIDALVADLKNEPNKTRMTVEFYGIVLHDDEIKLSDEIVLRKPIPEDFNIEILSSPFYHTPDFPEPTAFLDISLMAKNRQDLYNEITKTITILQLFRPMCIKWHIYRINSVSYNPCFERKDPPIEKHLTFENYIIKTQDVDTLKKFWNTVSPILPQNVNSFEVKNSSLSNAFRFYLDSLSQSGMIERKIASVVIGLESIFLKNIEENNKSKNLTSRITKLLGSQKISPIKMKEIIGDAYFCRTKFLHGDLLSEKERQRLDKKYDGDLNNLLAIILEYLRLSIVILISFQSEKKLFIEMIDNSLKDENANQQLIEFLNRVNPTIRITEQI